jgi:hypothetical protein
MSSRPEVKDFIRGGLLVCLSAVAVCAQTGSSPTSFFIAAHIVTDTSPPSWSEYIMDVEPEDGGSLIRHIRLSPAAVFCPSTVAIRAVEKKANLVPGRLVVSGNPCSMSEKDFRQALLQVSFRSNTVDEAPGFTIVATCEDGQRIVKVPNSQTFDLKALRKRSPTAAEIVDLYSSLEKRFVHGELNTVKPPKDQQLQAAAQKSVPDLKSGRFEAGFEPGRLKEILAMYAGPIAALTPMPKLVDFEKWKFLSYVDPAYPTPLPTGKQMQGPTTVELEFYVDPTTGYIRNFRIVRGSELYRTVTTDAVVQWVFDPHQKLPAPLRLTLDYSQGCKVTPAKPSPER